MISKNWWISFIYVYINMWLLIFNKVVPFTDKMKLNQHWKNLKRFNECFHLKRHYFLNYLLRFGEKKNQILKMKVWNLSFLGNRVACQEQWPASACRNRGPKQAVPGLALSRGPSLQLLMILVHFLCLIFQFPCTFYQWLIFQ